MQQVKTKYTRSGDIHIAYQAVGEGTLDLIYVQGWVSHVEMAWEVSNSNYGTNPILIFCRLVFNMR